ncbi:MAG: O-antigen ligase family protein [Caulobacterales bacterium]
MTTAVGPGLRAREGEARPSLVDIAAFAAAVLLLLIYSQGWEFPLTGGVEETTEDAFVRTLFLPAYAAGVFLFALGPWRVTRALTRQPLLVALVAIAAISIFWSVSPEQTERRIFALVLTTLGGVTLAARYSWARLAEVIALVFALLAVLSLITCVFIPSIGRMSELYPGAWRGLWPEKNGFGGNMALGAVLCAAAAMLNPRRASPWWGMAALSVLLVVMSSSKTSLVSLFLGFGAVILVGAVRRGAVASVVATWAAVVAVALVAGFTVFASNTFFGLLGKEATLTGRTKLWAAVWRQIAQRPWQGYGYAAIWDETDQWGPLAWITKDAGFRAHHAHNTWLEQWLALGVPGLAAWVGFYLQTLTANVVALYREKGAYLALPFFVVYTLMSLTESVAVTYNDLRWVIFVALAAKLALPDETASA